jgi:hypothetical protein
MKSFTLVAVMFCVPALGADPMQEVRSRLETVDSYAATEWIQSQGSPLEVAKLYNELVKKFYFEDKGAKTLAIIGPAGVQYALLKSLETTDQQIAIELKGMAKTIAYKVASNSWPGWGDEGVKITPYEMAIGLNAAKANLRLGAELDRPKDKMSGAHWLLGAQLLANGQPKAAIESFKTAAVLSEEIGDKSTAEMNRGYIAISEGSKEKLEASIQSLQAMTGDENAKFYADQLRTASRILWKQ